MVVLALAAVGFALVIVLLIGRRLKAKTAARLQRIRATHTPETKVKIVFVFYQIATQIPRAYKVVLPSNVAVTFDAGATIVTLGLEQAAVAPLECMGLNGYAPQFLFWMMLPVALTLIIVGLVLLSSSWGRLLYKKLAKVRASLRPKSKYARWSARSDRSDRWSSGTRPQALPSESHQCSAAHYIVSMPPPARKLSAHATHDVPAGAACFHFLLTSS
jgi:hypothetical protein